MDQEPDIQLNTSRPASQEQKCENRTEQPKIPRTIYTFGLKTAWIVCPECGFSKSVNVSSITKYGTILKVKCKCGNILEIMFEGRQYRKEVRLLGRCINNRSESYISISNVSRKGMSFSLDSKTFITQPHDVLQIKFTLDGQNKTELMVKVLVKEVNGRKIRAQFVEMDAFVNKEIGFYLMP